MFKICTICNARLRVDFIRPRQFKARLLETEPDPADTRKQFTNAICLHVKTPATRPTADIQSYSVVFRNRKINSIRNRPAPPEGTFGVGKRFDGTHEISVPPFILRFLLFFYRNRLRIVQFFQNIPRTPLGNLIRSTDIFADETDADDGNADHEE